MEIAWLVDLAYWGFVWVKTLRWYRASKAQFLAKTISQVAGTLMTICLIGATLTPLLAPTTEEHPSRYLGLLIPGAFLYCAWRIHRGGRFMYESEPEAATLEHIRATTDDTNARVQAMELRPEGPAAAETTLATQDEAREERNGE